jgi:hypothetical protein
MLRRALLACGILSSLVYVAMTVLVARQWPEYSSFSQTISELSAIDAPTRSAWAVPGGVYTLLVTLFGWGVVRSAGPNRPLRAAGALILVYGALGVLWPLAPMHQRHVLAAGGGTASDTMHLTLAGLTVSLMLVAMSLGAAALDRRFRIYSIVSLIVLGMCGALTFLDSPHLARNEPTPWIGLWERINIGVFLLWVVSLAIVLWPPLATRGPSPGVRRPTDRQPR